MFPNIARMAESLKIGWMPVIASSEYGHDMIQFKIRSALASDAFRAKQEFSNGRPKTSSGYFRCPPSPRMMVSTSHFLDGFRSMFLAVKRMLFTSALFPHALFGTRFSGPENNLRLVSVELFPARPAFETLAVRDGSCTLGRAKLDLSANDVIGPLAVKRRFAFLAIQPNTVFSHDPECYRVNSVELSQETIPSQAAEGEGSAEGVTTRSVSPNNNRSQECPTGNGRDSLNMPGDRQKLGINSPMIT